MIPYVSRDNQLELLLIDQTVDANSQAWPDQGGIPRDNEVYRNAYWEFLGTGSGGVTGSIPTATGWTIPGHPKYSDLVQYKAVLCYATQERLPDHVPAVQAG